MDRLNPAWTTNLLDLYLNTIDTFLKYDNVLAFNIGNEIVTMPNVTAAAPYIKAAARDVKAYLKSKSSGALGRFISHTYNVLHVDVIDQWPMLLLMAMQHGLYDHLFVHDACSYQCRTL